MPYSALALASSTGCEATLEALVGMGVLHGWLPGVSGAQCRSISTLECLRRLLGMPLNRANVVRRAHLKTEAAPAPAPALAWVEGQQEPRDGVSSAL